MILVKHSVTIDRPADEVFAYLASPENMPRWQEGVVEASVIGGLPAGPDTTVEVRRKFMGQTLTIVFETTEFVENQRFAFASASGPVSMSAEVEVASHDSGTVVTFLVSGKPNGVFGLAGPFIEQTIRRETLADSARLKAILESGQ